MLTIGNMKDFTKVDVFSDSIHYIDSEVEFEVEKLKMDNAIKEDFCSGEVKGINNWSESKKVFHLENIENSGFSNYEYNDLIVDQTICDGSGRQYDTLYIKNDLIENLYEHIQNEYESEYKSFEKVYLNNLYPFRKFDSTLEMKASILLEFLLHENQLFNEYYSPSDNENFREAIYQDMIIPEGAYNS